MIRHSIFILLIMLPIAGRAELLSLDNAGELALSTDSIEIKNRDGKKIVQGVVYGFEGGVKKIWPNLLLLAEALEARFK